MKKNSSKQRATILAVAEDAGVSRAAVSKVLNNAYGVSDALREKVEASIARLGYRPSFAARGMRGKTFTFGVLLGGIENPLVSEIVRGISSVADSSGYKVVMAMGRYKQPLESGLIESMIDLRLDGLILIAPRLPDAVLNHFAQQIPMVVVGHHQPSTILFDTVNCDDAKGAGIAVYALVERGYQDICMLSMPQPEMNEANIVTMREAGYTAAMNQLGLQSFSRIDYMPIDPSERARFLQNLISNSGRPRALFCWSDLDAIPALDALRDANIWVPKQVAIIGYDNSPPSSLALFDLTSVDQRAEEQGRIAAQTVLSRISGRGEPNHVILQPKLVARSSH
ncbi:LacI family DNA-binding transcriptional regulator [Agrobacterium pusense]|uniref:Transcriptional regulator n=1 Tax=Agrobacterium pusense TaxID=648995 RepID=U4Q4H5_9HYPH|nr:LacI family DNA-binding transcriptional regulator [Agrobacterium pusense]CDI12199.1 Transcriptional regulator [Agrobacterium pusense]